MSNNFQNIPFQNIVKFGQQTMLDRPLFSTSWILGRFCNYKCSYCWPYARSDTVDHQPLAVYKKVVDEIKRQARKNGFTEFHWSFSGGEPTAYKKLLELIDHLNDGSTLHQSLHMTTNLSPGIKWWKNWCDRTVSMQRRSITASHHEEFAREQEFGDKCLQLIFDGVYVTINQVMVPERFYELYEKMERFHSRGINVTLKPQSDPTASNVVAGYTADMLYKMRTEFPQHTNGDNIHQIRLTNGSIDYFLDQAERFNAYGFNKFTGWTCNAGYQSVIIIGNDVKRGYSCRDISIGTLENFELRVKPPKCVTATCVSSADSKIPKERNNDPKATNSEKNTSQQVIQIYAI